MFNLHDELQKINITRPGMPLVMGILNVTPDSFSDGGEFFDQKHIESRVLQMIEEGTDIIDIGGESTRPGAEKVSLDIELERVLPVIEWIKARFDVPVSVDTYKTKVMAEAISLGADMINDVNALQSDGAVKLASETGVTVCLMHKKGNPENMQAAPHYDDVIKEVSHFLEARAKVCLSAGIEKNKIILDPGFGFGKTLTHNTQLFNELSDLLDLNYPILVGVSRKRMIGELLDNATLEKRLHGSVAAAVLAGMKGASIVRVHDVAPTVEALKVVAHLV